MKDDIKKKMINDTERLIIEGYEDLAQPSVQVVGQTLGRTVKALLAPVRGMLWGWERIEEVVEKGVMKRFEDIPEENMKSPEPEIAVPLVQALSYTAQNETLREMYLNLLANSMNKTKEKQVHQSFVELIKQMNTLDAILFKVLSKQKEAHQIIQPDIGIIGTPKIIANALPEWFIGYEIKGYDIFDISSSLIRLRRLGVIELISNRVVGDFSGYDELKNNKLLKCILEELNSENARNNLEIIMIRGVCYINDYGRQFLECCM